MKSNWIISQKWSHALFLNYKVDPQNIAHKIPKQLNLDCYQNDAYISIVPFYMSNIRFPFTPVLPFSNLWELNLRTYVTCQGIPGIYFFTLDTNHKIGNWIAKTFFKLPYRFNEIEAKVENDRYLFHADKSFKFEGKIGNTRKKSELDQWLVERYRLFTEHQSQIYQGTVIHDPWNLYDIDLEKLEDHFSKEFGFQTFKRHFSLFYSPDISVKFKPFKRVDN